MNDDQDFKKAFRGYGFGTGFLKLSILKMASEGPVYGYAIMKEISRLTDGGWNPSPGSVYPALQEMQSEGLVESVKSGRKRMYVITPLGEMVLGSAINHLRRVMIYVRAIFPEERL